MCYIYAANGSVASIESVALWDGPAMFILIASSTAMVVMVIRYMVIWPVMCIGDISYEPITDSDQFTKALKQILPLAAFPMLFFIFEVIVFTVDVYSTNHSAQNEGITITAFVCVSLWSMASGATVIIHICVARILCGRKRKPLKPASASDTHP